MKRTTPALTFAALALTATLTACGTPTEDTTDTDSPKTAIEYYDEAQPKVESHIKTFGILETADMCKTEPGAEYDTMVEKIFKDAGLEVQGTSREDTDYMGVYDATSDTIVETCENYNKN